jgi:16S rRNA processing protein RimM
VGRAAERLEPEQERGSGERGRTPEPRYLAVGQVAGAHGVRGELKVDILTDDPHRFGRLRQVYVGYEDQEPTPMLLKGYRLHKGRALLRLVGFDDRAAAQTLQGLFVYVSREEAIPLEQGEYFEHQILDLEVWTVDGEYLGRVADIIYTGANEVYLIRGTGPGLREILLPAIKDVVLEVDLDAGRLVVRLLEGLR